MLYCQVNNHQKSQCLPRAGALCARTRAPDANMTPLGFITSYYSDITSSNFTLTEYTIYIHRLVFASLSSC